MWCFYWDALVYCFPKFSDRCSSSKVHISRQDKDKDDMEKLQGNGDEVK